MPGRAPAAIFILTMLALMSLAGCGGDGERSVEGVIIDVEASSLTSLESFTVRSNEGETLVFGVSADAGSDPQEGFFPGHLRTHALAGEQVTVYYEEVEGQLLALRLVHD